MEAYRYRELGHVLSGGEYVRPKPIKLLLANAPEAATLGLRGEIHNHEDIELVGDEPDPVRMLVRVGETNADVVVITDSETGEDPAILSHLLTEYPFVVVLAVDPRAAGACIYRLRIERTRLRLETQSALIEAIRTSCCHDGPFAGSRQKGRPDYNE